MQIRKPYPLTFEVLGYGLFFIQLQLINGILFDTEARVYSPAAVIL